MLFNSAMSYGFETKCMVYMCFYSVEKAFGKYWMSVLKMYYIHLCLSASTLKLYTMSATA